MIKPFSHVVVDGSNLATEGRTEPSLKQLNEAVLAFMKEFPGTKVTVVVDATFGHRVDRRERAEFDEAINNNELVAPPAGAVGRGDGFVLTIADKVKASVLSNDSYQEFHDQYKWLFDEGRLIGGKPVPNVGWVFIQRLPVRKQAGRETAATLRRTKSTRAVMRPMPVPKSPPPSSRATATAVKSQATNAKSGAATKSTQPPKLNDLTTFLNFVEKNPIGIKVKGSVDSYASHGVYVKIGEVSGYLPMRLMASPTPRSAREHVKLGASLNLVVVGYTPSRRSVELAVSGMETLAQKTGAKSTSGRTVKSASPRATISKKAKRRSQHPKSAAKKNQSSKKR
ncbi:MAG: NYN domain-containing protein [Acidimicrobiaceae bacterium]